MPRKRPLVPALCAVALVAFVGCSGKPAPSRTPTPPTTAGAGATASAPAIGAKKAAQVQTVRVAGTEKDDLKNLPFMLEGWGTAAGLKLEYKENNSGTNATKALLSGEADFGILSADHALRDTSGLLRIVAMLTRYPGAAILVDANAADTIKSVKDLVGKKVGISSLGAGSHQFTLALLRQAGVDSTTVSFIPGTLDATERLGKGEVDAMYALEPHVTRALKAGLGSVLVDARKSDGVKQVYGADEIAWTVLATREDVAAGQPDLVKAVVAELRVVQNLIMSAGLDAVMARVPAAFKKDEALYRSVLESYRMGYAPEARVSRSALDTQWRQLQVLGAVKKDVALPWDKVVDTRFA